MLPTHRPKHIPGISTEVQVAHNERALVAGKPDEQAGEAGQGSPRKNKNFFFLFLKIKIMNLSFFIFSFNRNEPSI